MVGTNCVFHKWSSGMAWILLPVVGWGPCPSYHLFPLLWILYYLSLLWNIYNEEDKEAWLSSLLSVILLSQQKL